MTQIPTSLGLNTLEQSQVARIAGTTITLGGLVSAAVILILALAASWLVTRALRRVRERADRTRQAVYLLERLTAYGIIVVGVMAAISAAGVNLSSLTVFAGALGIGVGLGLQGVVKEFVSGLFLIFDRMVSVGDYIEIEDIGIRGAIMEIGPRATRVRTNDNVNVLVPNSRLIEQPVTNWTLKGDTRRIHVPFAVAYGTDRGKVRDAVLAAARASPFTLPETDARKSQVWLVGFGDSSLNFELLVWPDLPAVKRPNAIHAAYTWAIDDALRKAGHADKLSRSIALITQPAEASTDRLDKVRELLAQHVAAVIVIPFDPALDEGDEIDWDRLHKKTRRAYLEATAALIEGLA